MVHVLAQNTIEDLGDTLRDDLGPWDYFTAAAIVVVAVVVGRIARRVVRRLIDKSRADDFLGDLFGRVASYVIVSFGLIYALESLGIAVAPILGALGIVGIALAFALQNILENFVAGIILQLRRPFTLGDEIESSGHEGRVSAVDARTVSIETADGETIRLPSAEVIRTPIINHTQNGMRRTTLDVGVAYGTDLDHAASVAFEAVCGVEMVFTTPAPQALAHEFGDSSINFALRFWHGPSIGNRWEVRDKVLRAVNDAFAANDIEIPFPQRVLHTADDDEEPENSRSG